MQDHNCNDFFKLLEQVEMLLSQLCQSGPPSTNQQHVQLTDVTVQELYHTWNNTRKIFKSVRHYMCISRMKSQLLLLLRTRFVHLSPFAIVNNRIYQCPCTMQHTVLHHRMPTLHVRLQCFKYYSCPCQKLSMIHIQCTSRSKQNIMVYIIQQCVKGLHRTSNCDCDLACVNTQHAQLTFATM
jgi:hypothetical protein